MFVHTPTLFWMTRCFLNGTYVVNDVSTYGDNKQLIKRSVCYHAVGFQPQWSSTSRSRGYQPQWLCANRSSGLPFAVTDFQWQW